MHTRPGLRIVAYRYIRFGHEFVYIAFDVHGEVPVRELAGVICSATEDLVSVAASGGRSKENVRTIVSSTESMVQSSSSIPGLSDGCAFAGSSSDSTVVSFWWGRGVCEDRESHVRRRESMSRARSGKWCLRINPMHRKRSISSLSEPAKSGARLSTVAGRALNSHGRRKWRQRLHGTPSSHFSLRRRHSAQLRDGCQSRFCLVCLARVLVDSAVLRANRSLSLFRRQTALLGGPWVLDVHGLNGAGK